MASTDTKGAETNSTTNDRSVMTAVCIGAFLGGVWGWLYLTSSGIKVRDRVDPALDRVVDALDKMQSLRATVKSLAVVAIVVGYTSIGVVIR